MAKKDMLHGMFEDAKEVKKQKEKEKKEKEEKDKAEKSNADAEMKN